jgi:Protein of unknown function (DUF1360)
MDQSTVIGAKQQFQAYAPPDEHKPLAGYALLMVAFNALCAGALVASRSRLTERVETRDLTLLTIATHKLSRLIAKDKVTSAVRAPFTRFEDDAGPSEVSETPRGTGVRKAVGELISCPFCVAQWIAAAALFGLIYAPRTTRFVAAMFTIVAGSDFLQLAYKAAQDKGL